VLLDFLSTTRKVGERVYASKEKSCCKKEDRKKEEISFPKHVHTHFGWGRFSPAFFLFFLFFFCCGLHLL
jgi:hypothetical protein